MFFFVGGDGLMGRCDNLAQPHALGVEAPRLLFGIGEIVTQLAVSDPCRVEHVLEAELLAFRLFIGAQGFADRIDQLADRALDGLELADLVLGVDQEIANGLVFMAKLRRDRKEQLFVELDVGRGRALYWPVAALRRASRLWRRFCGRER